MPQQRQLVYFVLKALKMEFQAPHTFRKNSKIHIVLIKIMFKRYKRDSTLNCQHS